MSEADPRAAAPGGLTELSAVVLARLVRSGEVSAVEVVEEHLGRVARLDHDLNAVVHLDADHAWAQAHAVDEAVRRREHGGTLVGVPFVVKDNVDVHGQVTACGSRAHGGAVALTDAPVVRRLREQGAVLLGRTNMDELAMGASTQTSAHGPTRNPVDRRRSPGGSSGGSAAAVAAGFAPLAVGSDTGGSIREPASQCGVVGMAPSPGLVPLAGVVPFASDLDRVGPLTRTVADAALALGAMSGRRLTGGLPRRVAVVEELVGPRNRPEVLRAFDAWVAGLRGLDVEVVRVSVPDAAAALSAYMTLTSVASVDWLAPRVATGLAGEEVVRRYELGLAVRDGDPAAVARASGVRDRLRAQVGAALRDADVLLSPTMPTPAPLLAGEITPEELADPMSAPYTDCWTVVANLAGLPALSVPAPVEGLPVGAMLMGRPGSDADLFLLASLV